MADASGGQRVEVDKAKGSSPATVVPVVRRIGRMRRLTASVTASSTFAPCLRLASMTSSRTIALLTTIPISANTPSKDINPKG